MCISVRRWLGPIVFALMLAASSALAQNPARRGQTGQGPSQRVPGRGGAAMGPGMFAPWGMMQPELAARTAQIMALRKIHAARFSAKDVGAALPVLREMREGESALHARSVQILERERQALLAAGPDDDPPQGTGDAMRELAEAHRDRSERLWGKLTDAIGAARAGVIRRLLGADFGPGPMMPGMGPGMPMGPGMGPGGPGMPGMGPGMPMGPGMGPGGPGMPGMGPGMPMGPGMGPGGPGMPGMGPDGRGGAPMLPMPPESDGESFGEMPVGEISQGPQPPPGRRQGGQGGPGGPGMERRGQFPGMGGMMGMPSMMGMGPRLSLADLIELLEQKQAAMRK